MSVLFVPFASPPPASPHTPTNPANRHNSTSLTIVRAVTKELPNAVNIAFFDSAFHATIPRHISTYPIDPKVAIHNKLRKYGFHGISYSFILHTVATYLQQVPLTTNLIALHLGSGASVCCIKSGEIPPLKQEISKLRAG